MIEHNGIEFYGLRGHPEYYISTCGKVLSAKFGKKRIMKLKTNNDGYLCVNLWGDGKRKHMLVHRLVAIAFLPGFNPDLEVDHKDHNRANNNLHNLRMVPHSDNCRNQANAVGVYEYLKRGNIPYYRAWWFDENGKRHFKHFNINKLGDEEAYRLATEHRQAMVDLYYNRPVLLPSQI